MNAITFMSFLLVSVMPVDPSLTPVIQTSLINQNPYSDVDYEASIIEVVKTQYYYNVILNIVDKKERKACRVVVGEIRSPVEETVFKLYRHEHILIMVTKRKYTTFQVFIIDLVNFKIKDQFMAIFVQFSPSLRYIACIFINGDSVLIYDLESSPEKNRLYDVTSNRYDKQTAGIPVYPKSCVQEKEYLVQMEPDEVREKLSPFLWSKDEKQLVFIWSIGFALSLDKSTTTLVRIDLTQGIDRPRIFEKQLTIKDEYLRLENKNSFLINRELNKKNSSEFAVAAESIEWDGPKHVKIRPIDYLYYKKYYQPEIRLELP